MWNFTHKKIVGPGLFSISFTHSIYALQIYLVKITFGHVSTDNICARLGYIKEGEKVI